MISNNNSAKQIIALAYSDSMEIRNLDMRVKCENLYDFIDCVNTIGEYNDFNITVVQRILKVLGNIAGDTENIKYLIGRESSPVIYLDFCFVSSDTVTLYEKLIKINKDMYLADEITMGEGKIRLWFD